MDMYLLTNMLCYRIPVDLERIQKAVRDSGSAKIIDNYTSVKDGAELAFNQVSSILKMVCSSSNNITHLKLDRYCIVKFNNGTEFKYVYVY